MEDGGQGQGQGRTGVKRDEDGFLVMESLVKEIGKLELESMCSDLIREINSTVINVATENEEILMEEMVNFERKERQNLAIKTQKNFREEWKKN